MAEKKVFERNAMRVECEQKQNVIILAILGELTLGNAKDFRELLNPLFEEFKESGVVRHVLLDFQDVPFIDSAGIGMLTGKYVGLKKSGKQLALCKVNEKIRASLAHTDLFKVVTVYNQRRDALVELLV